MSNFNGIGANISVFVVYREIQCARKVGTSDRRRWSGMGKSQPIVRASRGVRGTCFMLVQTGGPLYGNLTTSTLVPTVRAKTRPAPTSRPPHRREPCPLASPLTRMSRWTVVSVTSPPEYFHCRVAETDRGLD